MLVNILTLYFIYVQTKEKNEIPSRAELFEKCFSKNGVPSGPEVVEALVSI